MEMTFRWYGSKFDTVTLEQIRQIPGVTGVITTLYDTTPGEVWTREAIHVLKEEVEASGLHISGIESVNGTDVTDIQFTSATELEFWVKTPLEEADIEEMSASQVMQEQ